TELDSRDAAAIDFADSAGAAFLIQDRATEDPIAWLVLVHDLGLDSATYTEMGNVIASRFAGTVARERSLAKGAWVSPPRALDSNALSRLLARRPTGGHEARHYSHLHRGHVIPIRAFVLPASMEGAAID